MSSVSSVVSEVSVASASMVCMLSVLLHDPGTAWEYGSNIDRVAQVVAAVRVEPLGAMKINTPPGAIASLSNDAEFFTGMPKP